MAKTSVTDLTVFDIDGMKCFERDGVAYLHLETCARGLGFTQTRKIGGVEYVTVRWDRVDRYLKDAEFLTKDTKAKKSGLNGELTNQDLLQNWSKPVFDSFMNEGTKSTNDNDSTSQVFPHKWGNDKEITNVEPEQSGTGERPEYIPEYVFYMLAMRGNSEAARAFQQKIACEVIPSIRKRGYYSAYGSEAETIAAVVADMNDKDKRKTIIKALQEANIKQADFIREYLGERNMRIPPSIEAMSDRNASAKYLMRGWGDRKFSQRSMPEPYNTDWQIPAYLKMLARSKVHGHHFVKFCGEYYFDKLGYLALIEKMYKNKKLKRDYAQAWLDAVDKL